MTAATELGRVLLRGGDVVDGTGAPERRCDVLLDGDRIAAVGPDLSADGARVRDVAGSTLLPGFIDVHTHDDVAVLTADRAEPKRRQGVTTCVVGNCGHGPAPTTTPELRRYSEPVLGAFPDTTWASFADYLTDVASAPRTVNVASLVPHAPVRAAVCGAERVPADRPQIERMCGLLADALDAGAAGLSLGLIYAPGNAATTEELDALASVVASRDKLLVAHIRSEGSRIPRALEEFTGIGRRTGCALHLSHLKLADRARHGRMPELLQTLDGYRDDGLDLTTDVYPYTAGSTTVATLFPPWTMDGGVSALLARLADPSTRARIHAELDQPWEQQENHLHGFGPEAVHLVGFSRPENAAYEGLSIAQIADGADPRARLIELVRAEEAALSIIIFQIDEADMQAALAWPWAVVGSDGLPLPGRSVHPRLYGTFPRVLSRYADRLPGYSFAEAVRRTTSMAADRFGLSGRGRIADGQAADLVLVDRTALSDRATFEDPRQFPAGVTDVYVGGVPQGAPGGRLVRVDAAGRTL